jgi:FkbM family methyltransferase
MKAFIKKIIKGIPISFTKNQKYDRQTELIIKKICSVSSNCVDVGCHKGEVFDLFLKYAPSGIHFGFEPIPIMYEKLKIKYHGSQSQIFELALSNEVGKTNFNYVISNPAYSGIKKRAYDKNDEIDQQIIVETDLLDNLIPENIKIDLIKIDVEGAELLVLEGAIRTIKTSRPIVIFEHGLGASEFYNSTPDKIYNLFTECNMKVSSMKSWLDSKTNFTLEEFKKRYDQKLDYYFIAY